MEKWLAPALENLAISNNLSDCCFVIESEKGDIKSFDCHKLIFSCASEVFERMLYGEFKESKSGRILLKGLKPEIFEKFRKYIYGYNLELLKGYDVDTLIDLAELANQYMVKSLTHDCFSILKQRASSMDISYLIKLFQAGHNMMLEDVIECASKLIKSQSLVSSINHFAIYELTSDVFREYVAMTKSTAKESVRFNMIETYLKVNGFDEKIDYVLDEIEEKDGALKVVANNNDENLKAEPSPSNKKAPLKSNEIVATQKDSNNEQLDTSLKNSKLNNVTIKYVKSLIALIDFNKMTPAEFYNGPGKSNLIDHTQKYEMLFLTTLPKCGGY